MNTCKIKTPAKLNIRLKVTGRRPDGYHDLVSVMVPVTVFDDLEFRVLDEERIRLSCDGFEVPADEDNLVWRAASAFFSRAGLQGGVSISLKKGIPVAAGMGGGSSDAAATLLALNDMWSRPLSLEDLHPIATRLGADVPFFLLGRPSLARGIGEILEPIREWPPTWYVIVTPRLEISTAWVYGQLKLKLTSKEDDYIIENLKKGSFKVSELLENDLETVTCVRYPVIETIKETLREAGAEGAMMTGSGPSVFGLFSSQERALSARESLADQDLGNVFLAGDWHQP